VVAAFWVAFVISVVHYADNFFNYDAYPQGDALGVPPPAAGVVICSWFIFTTYGLLALWIARKGHVRLAALPLAVYSLSGLIGIGHYAVPGATSMIWWRQLHVCADIACGLLLLVLAARMAWGSPGHA